MESQLLQMVDYASFCRKKMHMHVSDISLIQIFIRDNMSTFEKKYLKMTNQAGFLNKSANAHLLSPK